MALVNRDQLRAARAMLGWSQQELAQKAGVSLPSVKRIETGGQALSTRTTTLAGIQSALENAGIEFVLGKERYGIIKKNDDGFN